MAMQPTVSVIIPTLHRSKLLERAINSVIAQTYPVLEILVVIDGPDQETVAALQAFQDTRLKIICNPRSLTAAGARNAGVAQATGEWIAFLDDDDEWLPLKLERQIAFAGETQARFVTCLTSIITPIATYLWPREIYDNQMPLDAYLFDRKTVAGARSFIQTSSYLIRRSLFEQAPFRLDTPHDDWDFILRLVNDHGVRIATAPEVLVRTYMEQQRPSLSRGGSWRTSLAWIDSHGASISRRGYSGFCLGVVGSRAATERAYAAFLPILYAAFTRGSPTLLHVLAYATFWMTTGHSRRWLRGVLSGTLRRRQQSGTVLVNE